MTDTGYHPRRSVLYMPGSNKRALEKARSLPADCIIIDLEDSVAPEAKNSAREQAVAAVREGGYGDREVLVRVNGAGTPWADDDLRAVASSGATGVVLPKIEDVRAIDGALRILDVADAPARLQVWIMIETPRGVADLDAIVAGQPRLNVIVLGTTDLAKELRVSPMGARAGLQHALARCVLIARIHGLDIIDGVHLALDDAAGLEAACKQGRELGFDGKSLIHPGQIEQANACFGVTDAEAELAREILSAWQEARAAGRGMAIVRGQLVETMHVEEAQRTIALYEAVAN